MPIELLPSQRDAIWGSQYPGDFRRPTDTLDMRHPVLGKEYYFAEMTPVPDTPQWSVRIGDDYAEDRDQAYLFDDEDSAREYIADRRSQALEMAEEIVVRNQNALNQAEAAASFRRFSGAVRRTGLGYAVAVATLYRALFQIPVGEDLPTRSQLSKSQAKLVCLVEAWFCQEIERDGITEARKAEAKLKEIASGLHQTTLKYDPSLLR